MAPKVLCFVSRNSPDHRIPLTATQASGTSTKAGIVFSSGTVPSLNGTIVSGGIEAQTVCKAQAVVAVFSLLWHID